MSKTFYSTFSPYTNKGLVNIYKASLQGKVKKLSSYTTNPTPVVITS